MADVALEPASRRTDAELAEIFKAGCDGYYAPFDRHVDKVWTLEPLVLKQHKRHPVDREQGQARSRRERRWREPWQRADETVAHLEGVEGL